jgi:siroheme synthase-like protein
LTARKYQEGDLAGFQIVFVATGDRQVNKAVYHEGRSRGAWVNAADDPAHCDFILPSVLRRGDLTVAISSSGASPALARTIREELEIYFTQEYALLANLAGQVRQELQQGSITVPFETWRRALNGDARLWLMRGELARAKSDLLRDLGVAQ